MGVESGQLSLLNSESTITQEEEKSTAESKCSFEIIETHLLRTRAHFVVFPQQYSFDARSLQFALVCS